MGTMGIIAQSVRGYIMDIIVELLERGFPSPKEEMNIRS
jgi:hypothetical protein